MQAKGNEADVVGLEGVARYDEHLPLRNQLFVGISRSRGWVHLSGSTMERSPVATDVGRVLAAGDTLSFTCRPPKRNLDDVSRVPDLTVSSIRLTSLSAMRLKAASWLLDILCMLSGAGRGSFNRIRELLVQIQPGERVSPVAQR